MSSERAAPPYISGAEGADTSQTRPDSPYQGESNPPHDMDSLKPTLSKRRKNSKLGSVFRKLLGKKDEADIRSQIGPPSSAKRVEHNPTEFITSPDDPPARKAASVDLPQISRRSALGSHRPFLDISEESPSLQLEDESEDDPKLSRISSRRRRNSMPNTYSMTPEPLAEFPVTDEQSFNAQLEEANIGYAVTSGSHPKRRSRSFTVLRDTFKEHRMSPIQWRHYGRRSDEIRYWRDSVGPIDARLSSDHKQADHPSPSVERERHRDCNNDNTLVAGASEAKNAPPPADDKPDVEAANSLVGKQDKHQTFDFAVLASNIQQQDTVPVEERIVTVEVKLMDLEYAISKLQTRLQTTPIQPTFPQIGPPATHSTPHASHNPPIMSRARSNKESEQGSGSTASNITASTTATAASLHTATAPSLADTLSSNPFALSSIPRPTSATTAVHIPSSDVYYQSSWLEPPSRDPPPPPLETSVFDHATSPESTRPTTATTTDEHSLPIDSAFNAIPEHDFPSHLKGAISSQATPLSTIHQDLRLLASNTESQAEPSKLQEPSSPSLADPHFAAFQSAASRRSFGALTIDHYATLVTLIRREQSARIRLEARVEELQREIFLMKAQAQVDDESIGANMGIGGRERLSSGAGGMGRGRHDSGIGRDGPGMGMLRASGSQGSLSGSQQSGYSGDREREQDRDDNNNSKRKGQKGRKLSFVRRGSEVKRKGSRNDLQHKGSKTELRHKSSRGDTQSPGLAGSKQELHRKGSSRHIIRAMTSFDAGSNTSAGDEFETPTEGSRGWEWGTSTGGMRSPGLPLQAVQGGVF